MKLASYRDGSRDGQLVVVSRDLGRAHYATGIATRLQQVLDDWNFLSPQLEELSQALDHGHPRHAFAFDPALCGPPLPRAFRVAIGAAGTPPPDLVPAPVHAPGDTLIGPAAELDGPGDEPAFDIAPMLAAVTGDLPRGAAPERALEGIRLVMLAADVLRAGDALGDVADELPGDALGTPPQRVATAFAPIAVTPDELGRDWRGGRAHLAIDIARGGRRAGSIAAAAAMRLHFGQLAAQLARTGALRAGSIVASGPLGLGLGGAPDNSNGNNEIGNGNGNGNGSSSGNGNEAARGDAASAATLRRGERIRFEAKSGDGHSVFGAIELSVAAGG